MRLLARITLVVFLACGGDLPAPSYVQQQASALTSVRYPPPPARVEFVPDQPVSGAVWIDGEWVWRGRRWAWRQGRWVAPPSGARFSPWTMVRGDDGTIFYASGAWRDAKGQDVPEPAPVATARPSSGGVVNPEGETENTSQILRSRANGAPRSVSPLGSSATPPPSAPEHPAWDSGVSSDANSDGGTGP
jgi:hypothetical protein